MTTFAEFNLPHLQSVYFQSLRRLIDWPRGTKLPSRLLKHCFSPPLFRLLPASCVPQPIERSHRTSNDKPNVRLDATASERNGRRGALERDSGPDPTRSAGQGKLVQASRLASYPTYLG